MRVLVTGAAGFLGRRLVRRLGDRHEVTSVILPRDAGAAGVPLSAVAADLSDEACLEALPGRVHVVCHLAAELAPGTPEAPDEHAVWQRNVRAAYHLARYCASQGVKKVIYTSSGSLYARPPRRLPVSEDAELDPRGCYAASKLIGEALLASHLLPTQTVRLILRCSSIYGPGQRGDSVLPLQVRRTLRGEAPVVFGSGMRSQDFVFVEDVCWVIERAIEHDFVRPLTILNVGSGRETSMLELARTVLRAFGDGRVHEPVFGPPDRQEGERFVLDITRAQELLGYSPADLAACLATHKSEFLAVSQPS
jgi:UDP-glucose 4-epimerase